jgi:hypothetical protein
MWFVNFRQEIIYYVPRQPNSAATQRYKTISQIRRGHQFEMKELLEHPDYAVVLKVMACSQISPPKIIYNDRGSQLSSLHDCLCFASVSHAATSSLRQEQIHGPFVVLIATF